MTTRNNGNALKNKGGGVLPPLVSLPFHHYRLLCFAVRQGPIFLDLAVGGTILTPSTAISLCIQADSTEFHVGWFYPAE